MEKTQKELDKLYKNCIETWGVEAQLRQAQEECAELIVAINHFLRNRKNSLREIVEETADVFLMVHQMMEIVGKDKVIEIVFSKSRSIAKHIDNKRNKD